MMQTKPITDGEGRKHGALVQLVCCLGSSDLLDSQNAHKISKQAQVNNNDKIGTEGTSQQLENSAFKKARTSTEDLVKCCDI